MTSKDFSKILLFSDGSKNGKIAWKIDLESTDLEVKSVELLVNSTIFESGKIIWQLLGGSKAILPTPGKSLQTQCFKQFQI